MLSLDDNDIGQLSVFFPELAKLEIEKDVNIAEYIATAPEYASRGKEFSKDQIVLYYGDSRDAFAYFGKPTDGNEFYIHIL